MSVERTSMAARTFPVASPPAYALRSMCNPVIYIDQWLIPQNVLLHWSHFGDFFDLCIITNFFGRALFESVQILFLHVFL